MYTTKPILKDEEYQTLKAHYDFYHEERKRICGKSNCVTPEQAKLLPEPLTPEQISQLEVYDFVNNPPKKYLAYVAFHEGKLTTWTGEVLGEIDFVSKWQSSMGDTRYSVRVEAINGKNYYGTYFSSSGDYCYLTQCKK